MLKIAERGFFLFFVDLLFSNDLSLRFLVKYWELLNAVLLEKS